MNDVDPWGEDLPAPGQIDWAYERDWITAVTVNYVSAASDVARAARSFADHLPGRDDVSTRVQAMWDEINAAATRAEAAAAQCAELLFALGAVDTHSEAATTVTAIASASLEASIHFSTTVMLSKFMPGGTGGDTSNTGETDMRRAEDDVS